MKPKILSILFLLSVSLSYASSVFNDEISFFRLESNATENTLTIVSNIKQIMSIKIIDKSGFVRVEKKLHLDREIDLSLLIEGFYLIKVQAGNKIQIKRFYKGKDGIDIR